jgi:vacuolar protein sorting-associated protein 13A/C
MGLFHVFEQSVTGLVTKPLQGAKNEGVKGFFSGGVKSVFGIVVNPITGIMDAISKTAEGI